MASAYKSIVKKKQRYGDDDVNDKDVSMEDLIPSDEEISDSGDSDGEDDTEDGIESGAQQSISKGAGASGFLPRTRALMLTSRGVTHRHRHLLADLTALLPHTHKENKLDTKKNGGYNLLLNSLADLHSCNIIVFLEARKHGQDLYLWLARPPNGPTIKFSVTNLHTMGELGAGFAGNCLKGGRGVVVFDHTFDENGPAMSKPGAEYRGLIREMLRSVFCVPKRGVKGIKPFIDRIIGIFGLDGKIWIRVYEIRETDKGSDEKSDAGGKKSKGKTDVPDISLVEIGPRFVLTPIIVLEGSFGGPVIYENKEYVSPNQVRRETRLRKAGRYANRKDMQTDRRVKMFTLGLGDERKRKRGALDTRELFS